MVTRAMSLTVFLASYAKRLSKVSPIFDVRGWMHLCMATVATAGLALASDAVSPAAPHLAFPTSNLMMEVLPDETIPIRGTAADDESISFVRVKLNAGDFIDADLASRGDSQTDFSLSILPVSGVNTLTLQVFDEAGHASEQVVRTFLVMRPFSPFSVLEYDDSERPIKFESETSPFSQVQNSPQPLLDPSILELPDTASNALPPPSYSLTESQLLLATPSSSMIRPIAGVYSGLVQASPSAPTAEGTPASVSTEGSLTATVQATGSFSAKLLLDGQVFSFYGVFDNVGLAHFGTAQALTATIPRYGGTSEVSVQLYLDFTDTGKSHSISGSVTQSSGGSAMAVSNLKAARAAFNGLEARVPAEYLGSFNVSAAYTAFILPLPPASQPPTLPQNSYPQGAGYATITIAKNGNVNLIGTLGDSCPVAISATLSGDLTLPLFSQLYGKRGFLTGMVRLDHTRTECDLLAETMLWSRPAQDVQHYPAGWSDMVGVSLQGAKYTATPGESVVRRMDGFDADSLGDPLLPVSLSGNVDVQLTGSFMHTVTKRVNVNLTDRVSSISTNDTSFSLSVLRKSGIFSGSFTREDDSSQPSFKGVIYQKGTSAGGLGHFLTLLPPIKTYDGQSGLVRIQGVEPPDVTPPQTPSSFEASYNGSAFALSWDNPSDPDFRSVRVYRGVSADNLALLANIPFGNAGYTDTAVQAGMVYYYAIAALDAAGNESARTSLLTVRAEGPYHIYVDSFGGDDSQSGASPEHALKTLSAAKTAALAMGNGTSIGLKRGSFWREDLNLGSLDHCVIGAYGMGLPPIVTAFDVKSAWTQDQNFPNLWYVDIAHNGFGSHRPVVLDNSELMYRHMSMAEASATDGSYFSNEAQSANPLRIYINPAGDPNTDGHTYEVTTRSVAIFLGAHAELNDVVARGAISNNGPIEVGIESIIRRCVAAYGTKHNILLGSGLIEDCVMYDADAPSPLEPGVIPLVIYTPDATGLDATVRRLFSYTKRKISSVTLSHTLNDPSASHENIAFDSCIAHVEGPGSGYGGGAAGNLTLTNCAVYGDVSSPIAIYAAEGSIVRFAGSQKADIACTIMAPKATWKQVALERSGLGSTGSYSPITIQAGSQAAIDHVSIVTPGTYYGNAAGWVNSDGGSISINRSVIAANNIFAVPSMASYLASDNNIYIRTAIGPYTNYRGVYYNLLTQASDFSTVTSQEAHSRILTFNIFTGDTTQGDFRIDRQALISAGHDGDAGVTEHWDYNTRHAVSGPPERWPIIPATFEQSLEYILSPEAWDFYPH